MLHRRFLILITLLSLSLTVTSQPAKQLKNRLGSYFERYQNPSYLNYDKTRIEDIRLHSDTKSIEIVTNEAFLGQPFTTELVKTIYQDVSRLLPAPYNTWQLTILAKGTAIESLIPISQQENPDSLRTWGKMDYRGNPWVTTMSLPYSVTNGLQGRHISLWASHGRYYRNASDEWTWQRPKLFTTSEDLFTQTIVVPFLIPMLENAGAVIFTPRERDWQSDWAIVDNDNNRSGIYRETNGKWEWRDGGVGFAHTRDLYADNENPFEEGTVRMVETQTEKRQNASITWIPKVPSSGSYAVYVSYRTLPTSVPDAVYQIKHQGITTNVRVNQQMGGGTWVYLGTFDFDQGQDIRNSIKLTNHSNYRGHITADAIRLGGGMGNIIRGDSTTTLKPSYMPRFLEGARYNVQWSGFPYRIYATKEGLNDYGDDINARSLATNHLARGSIFMPNDTLPGLGVPIELALALHSDAGFRRNEDIVGTLGIYTTEFYDGRLATGLSRLSSRDFAEYVMSQVTQDMKYHFGNWSRRQLYDRNYSESREPQVPSMILEMLSHQNFADMKIGLDPYCKMILARSIYKGVLNYVTMSHGWEKSVTQPLPVKNLSAITEPENRKIIVSWEPTIDPQDSSADPDSYILYMRQGADGWDNGTIIKGTSAEVKAIPGVLYRFRIAAINRGGSSLKSQELCARMAVREGSDNILIVNAFDRIASPQPFDNDSCRGFDMNLDPGVAYYQNPGICGPQISFDKSGYGREGFGGMGYSTSQYEGVIVAGNTFDYPTLHAMDFLLADTLAVAGRDINISSSTASLLNTLQPKHFQMVDVIMGAQREDGYSHQTYTCFTDQLKQFLATFQRSGGNILISGAYIGEELKTQQDSAFAADILKYQYASDITTDSLGIEGMGTQCNIFGVPNRYRYSTARINSLSPVNGAFCTLLAVDEHSQTAGNRSSVAIAYQGAVRSIAFGFPLEMITESEKRRAIINAIYQFLCTR